MNAPFIGGSGYRSYDRLMRYSLRVIYPAIFGLLLAAAAVPARAEEDHDRARAALEAGQVRPLAEILEKVRHDYPGEVIDVELEEAHGRGHGFGRADHGDDEKRPIVYEIKVRMPDGRIVKLCYDALTGAQRSARIR